MRGLDDIRGQDHAVRTLDAMLTAQRVHHGLIFHGPTGVGKATTAVTLATVLLCQDRAAGSTAACGDCASCRHFVSDGDTPPTDELGMPVFAHPDLHWVAKEMARYGEDAAARKRKLLSIPVDVVRERLIAPAYKTAQLGHGKVFIVDEAELLNAAGQNAMLKTLEEPPAGTTLILITASEDRLLPTIRSRCQRIGFGPLPDDAVRDAIADDPAVAALSDGMRGWLVGFADGSIGRARLALEFDLIAWARDIRPRLLDAMNGKAVHDLGTVMAGHMEAFAKAVESKNKQASKAAANQQAARLMCALLTVEARRKLALAAGGQPVGCAGIDGWLAVIDAVEVFHHRLGANVNVALAAAGLGATVTATLSGAIAPPTDADLPLTWAERLGGSLAGRSA